MSTTEQSYYDIVKQCILPLLIRERQYTLKLISLADRDLALEITVTQIVNALTVVPDDKKQG